MFLYIYMISLMHGGHNRLVFLGQCCCLLWLFDNQKAGVFAKILVYGVCVFFFFCIGLGPPVVYIMYTLFGVAFPALFH